MVKLENLNDKKAKVVIEEVLRVRELIKKHRKLLDAVGRL